jgi:hypothetical protein
MSQILSAAAPTLSDDQNSRNPENTEVKVSKGLHDSNLKIEMIL